MTRVSWYDANARLYETGLDRGVLYPKDKPAVAWNGLTAVEQGGSDSAETYYMDGRPFLHLPKIREYTATLKAFTYPDEFSELMGLVEATDGMYVDSQTSDSFDLSYRTLIGDGNKSTQYGYKIHLVYNATVTQESLSYSTLETEVNPVDFGWEIQAVPVPLPGYHPSAHIVVDTRHLDEEKIAKIEDLLYGTDSETISSLPRPEVVFETLNYDGMVVVVDNGDGTWTASGSYLDVIQDSEGNFTLNNVEAQFYGDGLYYFGGTPLPVDPEIPPTSVDGGTSSGPGSGNYDGGTPEESGTPVIDGGNPGEPGNPEEPSTGIRSTINPYI